MYVIPWDFQPMCHSCSKFFMIQDRLKCDWMIFIERKKCAWKGSVFRERKHQLHFLYHMAYLSQCCISLLWKDFLLCGWIMKCHYKCLHSKTGREINLFSSILRIQFQHKVIRRQKKSRASRGWREERKTREPYDLSWSRIKGRKEK